MDLRSVIALILAVALTTRDTRGYKILGLFPHDGRSHFVMFQRIMEGLAKRGHEVHVLSHYPRKTPLANYTDLSVHGSIPLSTNELPVAQAESLKYEPFNLLQLFILYTKIGMSEGVMKSEAVQKLLQSKERYDLIVAEPFVVDTMLGFVHKFKAPLLYFSSGKMPPWTSDFMANPQNPSFIPHLMSRYAPKMTFLERVENTVSVILNLLIWYGFYIPQNERIMRKYIGEDTPPLLDLAKNASLVLLNTHSVITGARPFAPNVIEVGGVHIEPPKKLPQDIEKFIESSPHGVVYFCMGSLIRAATLPEQKKTAFLYAFSKLKERVLWKFEDESIATSDNLMVKAWTPQRDILAHPKVKLFIAHGGNLGALEAVSEGKPILGIPMFGDQPTNIKGLESQGAAKYLRYDTIDNETILEAIQEMLKPEYAERAKQLSKVFHDNPMSPMDTAIYWVEYVIRNNGARNLRSVAVDMPFYQYLLLDVIAFLIFCATASLFLIYYIFKCTLFRKKVSKNVKKKLK